MDYSNLILNARDIDNKKGVVSFYFANFEKPDRHKRLMEPNAFNRTFKNNMNRIRHYKNHNMDIVLGKVLELNSDSKGAYAVSKLSKSDEGRDILIQYEEGLALK